MSKYKKSLIIYTVIIVSLVLIFLGYVFHSLIIYERNLVENYVSFLVKRDKLSDKINENLFTISKLEKDNAKITDGIKKIYKSANLEYKENNEESTDGIYVYDIYNNDILISKVALKSIKKYKIMGILTSNEWEVVDFKDYFENGIYTYKITLPEDYELYINDNLVSDDYIKETSDVPNLEELTKFISISKSNVYYIDNLVYEPKIKILDENKKEVAYKLKGNEIVINKEFIKVNTYDEARKYLKEDFDIMALAENYSLFLTDDLAGERHGLSTLMPYLLEDTLVYERAYSFSRGPDILMVSDHTFKNPRFTNETLSNFTIYNDLAFSVEIHLEKNMIVSHKDKVDILNDRWYFIYYNNGYKWVKSEAVKK